MTPITPKILTSIPDLPDLSAPFHLVEPAGYRLILQTDFTDGSATYESISGSGWGWHQCSDRSRAVVRFSRSMIRALPICRDKLHRPLGGPPRDQKQRRHRTLVRSTVAPRDSRRPCGGCCSAPLRRSLRNIVAVKPGHRSLTALDLRECKRQPMLHSCGNCLRLSAWKNAHCVRCPRTSVIPLGEVGWA